MELTELSKHAQARTELDREPNGVQYAVLLPAIAEFLHCSALCDYGNAV